MAHSSRILGGYCGCGQPVVVFVSESLAGRYQSAYRGFLCVLVDDFTFSL